MKLKIIFLTLLFSQVAFAEVSPTDYTSVGCQIENEEGASWFTMKPLMLVNTDKGVARFIQITVVTKTFDVQYQLMIEKSQDAGKLNVLQNFKVDQTEVSKEDLFSQIQEVEIQQGAWKAHCEVSR